MSTYRSNLPQLSGELFLTDGGLETTLMFHENLELPEFAAFVHLRNDSGRQVLERYYRSYIEIARKHNLNFILESATWRASTAWGKKLGYSTKNLSDMNHDAIELLHNLRNEYANGKTKIVISGCMGSRGDGYHPSYQMSVDEAESYHKGQIETFCETDADMITTYTLPYAEEAIGLARSAKSAGMPVAIGFTVETDGRLPSGQSLQGALEQIDEATNGAPAYYMINCAHPTHFERVITTGEPWTKRIRAIRANASSKSHAELDQAQELDDGDPVELGRLYKKLRRKLESLNIFGGCCGTDHRHVEQICKAFASTA